MFTNSLLINCNSWNDFQSKLLSLNNTEKGNAFELLTKLYFKINPVFSFYDEVWLLSEVPQKTLEYLKIHRQDLGIDLIAKNGDEYHAIQCKFHTDTDSSVSYPEVATFIALFEGNKKFTQGYICSSANITSRNLDKITTKPITKILADTWQNLDKDFFDKARKLLNREAYSPIAYKPREHQIKALKQAVKHFIKEDNTRGKLIFPCGSGKSLTGYWITQELKSKATIIAVPSLSLVKQTLDIYLREIVAKGKKVKWLCICSDEGIGSEEDIVFKTDNLGVPCQTDPVYIKKWLLENKDENIVIFTTYQSGRIIAEVSKDLKFKFDVGIFDEAHKTVGSDKKLFSHLLFEENISIDKRIFMTATERFYAGSKDDIISMDDEDIYGDTFAQMSFKEAIEMELLTDYKVITIDVKKSEIADFIKENNLVQLNDKWKKETEARSLASMLALRKAMKLYPIKNAVSFHSSIDKAVRNKELQDDITDTYKYAPIDTYTVSGKMPTTKRNLIVKEFADSPRALITNARCLTEGVDVPNIDCIVFADPRKSKVDIVQALGRALRKKEGKEWGYVILPVVYDDNTQEIDNENFNEILAIVRGLASNDDRIIEYFKDKEEGVSTTKKENADQFQFEVISDYIDANQLSEQLQIKLWEKLSQYNWLPFEEAREQVRALGLSGQKEWIEYCRSSERNMYIPTAPEKVYINKGWISLGDWLGTGRIATNYREYLPFEEARAEVRALGFNSQKEWWEYCKSSDRKMDIPVAPNQTYKNEGWINVSDWLGYRNRKNLAWLTFEEARAEVRALGLKNMEEWKVYYQSNKKPIGIPTAPNTIYKNKGWISLSDWLGTGRIATNLREYLPFEEARAEARAKGFNTIAEWFEYSKSSEKPIGIPSNPNKVYKNDGWINWQDWLGSKNRGKNMAWLPFEEARAEVRALGFSGQKEWREYCRSSERNMDIPTVPESVYINKGWISLQDWLGSKNRGKNMAWLPFEEARAEVRALGLSGQKEWIEYCRSSDSNMDIPSKPERIYKNKGWISLGDWLGNGRIATKDREYLPFEEAREQVRALGFNTIAEWQEYSKSSDRPLGIPSAPSQTYKNDGWINWQDWLGSKNRGRNMAWLPFEEARAEARSKGFNTIAEWFEYSKSSARNMDVPTHCDIVYKNKGWKGWVDFLGKEKK